MWPMYAILYSYPSRVSQVNRDNISNTKDEFEVVNRTIAMYLQCITGNRPHPWLDWLP
jgi:hypothetical protein